MNSYDRARTRASQDECIPWNLIVKEFVRGSSIKALSCRYKIPEEEVAVHVEAAVEEDGFTRTPSEIRTCGEVVRSDLVKALMKLAKMVAKEEHADPDELAKLTAIAARLFSWPTPKAIDLQAALAPLETAAINLKLIATKPEELKRLAQAKQAAFQDTPSETDRGSRIVSEE
jgi:recombinational DNA repair protein RecT